MPCRRDRKREYYSGSRNWHPLFPSPLLSLKVISHLHILFFVISYYSLSLSLSLSLSSLIFAIIPLSYMILSEGGGGGGMKDSIRCCISCILPCGALDVIRIVHASGRVEEISRTVCAGDIMKAYPKHVLRKPPSSSSAYDECGGTGGNTAAPTRSAVVLPPNAELEKGKIYFLMPVCSSASNSSSSGGGAAASTARRRRKKRAEESNGDRHSSEENRTRLLLSDRYLTEILSEKVSTQPDRRRGRVGVWRPHLESIEETGNDL